MTTFRLQWPDCRGGDRPEGEAKLKSSEIPSYHQQTKISQAKFKPTKNYTLTKAKDLPEMNYICLFVYLCVCVFVCLCFCVYVYLCFVCLFVCVFVSLCVGV